MFSPSFISLKNKRSSGRMNLVIKLKVRKGEKIWMLF